MPGPAHNSAAAAAPISALNEAQRHPRDQEGVRHYNMTKAGPPSPWLGTDPSASTAGSVVSEEEPPPPPSPQSQAVLREPSTAPRARLTSWTAADRPLPAG
eukprot:EG_transcript_65285